MSSARGQFPEYDWIPFSTLFSYLLFYFYDDTSGNKRRASYLLSTQ